RLSKTDVFKVTTDGEECPIVNCFTPDEFCAIAEGAGFRAKFIGAAISLNEMSWIQQQFQALKDPSLDPESREFLSSLTYNKPGVAEFCDPETGRADHAAEASHGEPDDVAGLEIVGDRRRLVPRLAGEKKRGPFYRAQDLVEAQVVVQVLFDLAGSVAVRHRP